VLGAASISRATPLRRATLAGLLWLATAAAATPASLPDGFGGVKFGSTVAQATAAIPGLQQMVAATPAPGTSLPMAYYRAENQAFEGLRPCVAMLGFATDQFYEVRLDCGRDAKVATLLHRRYGAPQQEDAQFSVWQNGTTSVSLNRTAMTFTIGNRALTEAVHQLIIQKVLSGGGAPAPVAATPAH
jgi:hypothetical protein